MRTGIALGSNVGDRLANLRSARDAVLALTGSAGALQSSAYETEPVGPGAGDAAFLNAVIEVEFAAEPIALLDALQMIESSMGRPSKRPRNSPRTIDLDILYVGNCVLHNEEVIIPHPRLHQRRFVLAPLAEIRPDLILPGRQQTVAELFAALDDPAAVRVFSAKW